MFRFVPRLQAISASAQFFHPTPPLRLVATQDLSTGILRAISTSAQVFHPIPPPRLVATRNLSTDIVDTKSLPPELSKNVVKLTCQSNAKGGTCDIYLLPALRHAHNYFIDGKFIKKDDEFERRSSCENVRSAINSLKPQAVFLGLCPSHELKPGEMFKQMCGTFFDRKVIREFEVAYEEAQNYDAKVIFGDRPKNITLCRMSPVISSSLLVRSFFFLAPNKKWDYMDRIVNEDTIEKQYRFINQKSLLKKVFMDERDRYMSATLLKVAREHNIVVAVVGESHLSGIQKYWEQPIEVEELLSYTWHVQYIIKKVVVWFLFYYVIFRPKLF